MPWYQETENFSVKQLQNLRDKNALVIGGAGYLGLAISRTLAELGANVFIASRNLESNKDCSDALQREFPDSKIGSYFVDLQNHNSIKKLLADFTESSNGKMDILVNSGWSGKKNDLDSITIKDWNFDLNVCLTGVFDTCLNSIDLLAKSKGVILNIASMYGHLAPDYRIYENNQFANPPSYGAAKAGVIQLTKYLASFLSDKNIRVNCISPGAFPFPATQLENPEFIKRLKQRSPLNRIGEPHELKGAVALLCTDASSFITGQNICVDGGWSIW